MNKCYRIRFVSEKAQNIHNPGESDFLMHYGIKGQRRGVHRFQNEDGTLTEEGRRRYMFLTDTDHGRKMSLVGRIKFGKEVTKKTEADDEKRARSSISAQEGDKSGIDYRSGAGVSEYVHHVHDNYRDAANKDSVWKKHHISQDTAWDIIEQNKKYSDMVNHIIEKTKDLNKEAINASSEFGKSRETNKKPGPKYEAMNRASVKYWSGMDETATKYINKHFSGEEADIAKALVYWRFIDW